MFKKTFFSVVFIALAALSAKAVMVKTVDIHDGMFKRPLINFVSQDWNQVDSLVVFGTMSPDDFKIIRKMLKEGCLTGIDLSGASLYFNMLPDSAFCIWNTYDYPRSAPENPLRYVTLMDGLEYIGNAAFLDCRHLQQIDIPSTVREIGELAFCRCYEAKGEVNVPKGVTFIRIGTFHQCGCESVRLPEGIEWIDKSAFSWMTHITSLTLPASLKAINIMTLYGLESLKTIYCLSAEPPEYFLGEFGYFPPVEKQLKERVTIYVPRGAGEAYKHASGWWELRSIIVEADMPTDVRGLRRDSPEGDYYGLDGRRTSTPGKGIYIRNGKKVVMGRR